MGVKCFQTKIRCSSDAQREYLQLTHKLFNQSLPPVISLLYAARRGDHGREFKSILESVRSAQGSKEQVEAITSLTSEPGEGGWKDVARATLAQRRILFDREKLLPGFSSEFRRKIFEMAFQVILSHDEKLKEWRVEHAKWVQDRAEWETANEPYMRVRPAILEFMGQEGRASKRRGRWHRWLEFLASHPILTGWRGNPSPVQPLTEEEITAAEKHPRTFVRECISTFFKKNEELHALDVKHEEYERRFARSWAKRKHNDDYKVVPTLTLPSIDKHPAWFSFKRGETYRKLDLRQGTIDLKVIRSDSVDERTPKGWETYRFEPDPRLLRFAVLSEPVTVGRTACDLLYSPTDGTSALPARVQGAKLVIKNGMYYLYVSVFIADAPTELSLKQESCDKYSYQWVSKHLAKDLNRPVRTMAIDLGVRHLAVATVMESDRLLATRFINNRPVSAISGRLLNGVPSLDRIKAMKSELRRRLRARGKPIANEQACKELHAHLLHLSEDRFKKSARAIVDFARVHKVDIIILEALKDLVPDAARERGINKALINWNRGQTADWIRQTAQDYGIRVKEVPAYWTSQICHKCNCLGYRYRIGDDEQPETETGGKLFLCAGCGYNANADFNASINLNRVFSGRFPECHSAGKGRVRLGNVEYDLTKIRATVETRLREIALKAQTPF